MKSFPSLTVEVTRGGHVESRHLVDAVIADADGKIVRVHGIAQRPVFPRSANKALQALALVESGAADKFGLEPRHIALACASHNGEEMHVAAAGEMLAKAGMPQTCLECGAQLPSLKADQDRLALAHEPARAIHNNCSGKHSGFLCYAAGEGIDPAGYVKFGHKVQRAIAANLTEVTGAVHGEDNYGIDGCSIPTYAIPLENLAVAYARFSVGADKDAGRAAAMVRIRDACMAHPEMVAGTGRFDTEIIAGMKGRVFSKTGAEGVFVVSLPELGIGFALKAHDGAARAAEVATARLIESLLQLSQTEAKLLKRLANPQMHNWNGIHVGGLR